MIASLMMYARPELVGEHDRLWQLVRGGLRQRGVECPASLSQTADEFAVWRDPALVLSQTCGMPYRLWLHEHVALVGAPDYGVENCPPGYYRSALVVREDDERFERGIDAFRDACFAYNQTFSQSGFGAAYWHTEQLSFWFNNRVHTGAHLQSAKAVAEGRADIAALDAVSWRLMQRYESWVSNLRVLEWTRPTPGLPLITRKDGPVEVLFNAVSDAVEHLHHSDRDALGIRGVVRIPKDKYLNVPNPPESAVAL